MRRQFVLVVLALALVAVGWTAGIAQTRVADFYITVDAPAGEVKATCSKGCDWPTESEIAPASSCTGASPSRAG